MEDPTFWEQVAASKTVIWMFLAFVVFVGFAFRPGAGKSQRDSADIPFRNEDKPASDEVGVKKEARP